MWVGTQICSHNCLFEAPSLLQKEKFHKECREKNQRISLLPEINCSKISECEIDYGGKLNRKSDKSIHNGNSDNVVQLNK